MRPWRRGWRPRWPGGGRSVAGWRARCRCCAGRRPGRRRQRRVVRRSRLARAGVAGFGLFGRGAAPLHRGPRRHRRQRAVPAAGQVPERPVRDAADHGPDRRGGRGCPPGRALIRDGDYPSARRWPWRSSAWSPVSPTTASALCSWPGWQSRSCPAARPDGPGVRPHPDHGAHRGWPTWPPPSGFARSALAGARDAGDLSSLGNLLEEDWRSSTCSTGRYEDAATHLREGTPDRFADRLTGQVLEDLDCCGNRAP